MTTKLPDTLFRLWTCERACVLTFNRDAADLFKQEGGRVTSTILYKPETEKDVRESDREIHAWLSRYLSSKDKKK